MIKMTFGLQPHHIERIEQESSRWDRLSKEIELDNPKGYMLYDRDFWIKLGSEFGWEPLTLSLYYLQYLNNLKHEMLSDCVNLLEDLEPSNFLIETYGNIIMNSKTVLEK